MRLEKKRLLYGSYFPLNNSGSKLVHVGLDPYEGFIPVILIIKSGVEAGIQFGEETFKEFISALPEILVELYDGNLNFELQNYKMCYTDVETCRFVPKDNNNKFELYMMSSTLRKISEMEEFLVRRLNLLKNHQSKFVSLFREFCINVGRILENNEGVNLTDSILINVYKTQHNHEDTLGELIYKFKDFVISETRNMLVSDDRLYVPFDDE